MNAGGALAQKEAEALAAVKPTTIQTLVFAKDTFKSANAAQSWAKDHGFKSDGVDETGDSYRIRQRPPSAFVAGSFRTIAITDGVSAVIGKIKSTRVTCVRDISVDDGVERPSAGAAPTAFRIWHAGANPTDHGTHQFTARSAEMLLDEQATRGNLYSIDVDHLSLSPSAPPASRVAVGWHRLDVRGGELWAVDVEWLDVARAGLETDPPAWRYFSPAYDVDADGEITSYLNTALTNNPATWNVTALASRAGTERENANARDHKEGGPMKYHEVMSELARMARESEDAEDAEKARQALSKLMPAPPSSGDAPGKGDDDDDDDDDKKSPPPAKKDGEDTKTAAEDDEDTKKASIAASRTVAELAAIVEEQGKELAELRQERERRERETLMATKQIDPKVASVLATKPLAVVREILAAMPDKPKRDAAAAEKIAATRGAGQGDGSSSALPPAEKARLDERMGLTRRTGGVRHEGVHQIFATLTPTEARALATKGGK